MQSAIDDQRDCQRKLNEGTRTTEADPERCRGLTWSITASARTRGQSSMRLPPVRRRLLQAWETRVAAAGCSWQRCGGGNLRTASTQSIRPGSPIAIAFAKSQGTAALRLSLHSRARETGSHRRSQVFRNWRLSDSNGPGTVANPEAEAAGLPARTLLGNMSYRSLRFAARSGHQDGRGQYGVCEVLNAVRKLTWGHRHGCRAEVGAPGLRAGSCTVQAEPRPQ